MERSQNITGNQSAAIAQSRASITSGFKQATAVIDALSNAKTSFFEDEKARSSTNSLTNSSALTQSGVHAIVSAINALSSPSTHLWSFKQFWYIAAAVTIVTILLPLVAGPIFRTTLQSFYYYKPYWRISLFVLVLAVAIMLDILTPPLAFLIVFRCTSIHPCFMETLFGACQGSPQKEVDWICYITGSVYCC